MNDNSRPTVNSLERTLIEKAGYDNGWEVVMLSTPSEVILASALHTAKARITKTESLKWRIGLPPGKLSHELTRDANPRIEENTFEASNDGELGALLNRAAKLARVLPDLPEIRFNEEVHRELSDKTTDQTEIERTVRQRIGQNIFRQSLMDYWGGACAVTGIRIPELLRASHIKGWADCESDAERLNVFNGLLLCAHLDALFDKHLMTVDRAGKVIFATRIDRSVLKTLNLTEPISLNWITDEHFTFLGHHARIFEMKEMESF